MNKKICVAILCALIYYSCENTPYVQGQFLYENKCANCHQGNGEGLGNLVPSLRSDKPADISSWVCIIAGGKKDTIASDNSFLVREMPAFKNLSPTELANIINYVNHSFRPAFKETTIKEIQVHVAECVNNK
jgi:mono/diheme cytochrome c family protein